MTPQTPANPKMTRVVGIVALLMAASSLVTGLLWLFMMGASGAQVAIGVVMVILAVILGGIGFLLIRASKRTG